MMEVEKEQYNKQSLKYFKFSWWLVATKGIQFLLMEAETVSESWTIIQFLHGWAPGKVSL
jgi:hypothetical protein